MAGWIKDNLASRRQSVSNFEMPLDVLMAESLSHPLQLEFMQGLGRGLSCVWPSKDGAMYSCSSCCRLRSSRPKSVVVAAAAVVVVTALRNITNKSIHQFRKSSGACGGQCKDTPERDYVVRSCPGCKWHVILVPSCAKFRKRYID